MDTLDILVLSPHPDDAELGCGGLISRYGADVMVFSWCDKSVNMGQIMREWKASKESLGFGEVETKKYPVREFNDNRQNILEDLYKIRGQYDVVLCPCGTDTHQDHQVIRGEAERAFRCNLLGYELPWNSKGFGGRFYVGISEADMKSKWEALSKYESQMNMRPYFNEDFIRGLAKVRGIQSGNKYAESFEVIQWFV